MTTLVFMQIIIFMYLIMTAIKIIEYIVAPEMFFNRPYDLFRYILKVMAIALPAWHVGMLLPVLLIAVINLFIKEQLQDKYNDKV